MKIGRILDGLGVELSLDDSDLVESAVVIVKVLSEAGETSVGLAESDGCSWVEQLGLITAARNIVEAPPVPRNADGDA